MTQTATTGRPLERAGATRLVKTAQGFLLWDEADVGPALKYQGNLVTDGLFGSWTPLGAELTPGGYVVAWRLGNVGQFTVWRTDADGNYSGNVVGPLSGAETRLKVLENSFEQDLNGDGHIGPGSFTTVEAFGKTRLAQVDEEVFLLDDDSRGPALRYQGAGIAAGTFGAWSPIGAEAAGAGYRVVWRFGTAEQFTVWNVDAAGDYLGNLVGMVDGDSGVLQDLEIDFEQDLNGDGTLGRATTDIETAGFTSLQQSADQFFLRDVVGNGPMLSYQGAPVTAGRFGEWSPIGAEAAGAGYRVAWRFGTAEQFTVWNVDAAGDYLGNLVGMVDGDSGVLQDLEIDFEQDLNGDGTLGRATTDIETAGFTSLQQSADQFFLRDVVGNGPMLSYQGAPVTAGTFGEWSPIGAEASPAGFQVLWRFGTADQFTVWQVDRAGRYVGNLVGAVDGHDAALLGAEAKFQQDLNSDGILGLGVPVSLSVGNVDLAEGDAGTTPFTFTVTRVGDPGVPFTVFWQVELDPIGGMNIDDFRGDVPPSGRLSFAAGELSKEIVVDVAGDVTVEADERFALILASPTNQWPVAFGRVRTDDAGLSIAADRSDIPGNGGSASPIFSPDGTRLAFHSGSTNLTSDDANGVGDIFVRNLASGHIDRVSTDAAGMEANGASFDAVFSPDGTKIAFTSMASNLVDGDRNEAWDVFLKDLATGEVTLLSTTEAGSQGDDRSFGAHFSPDGSRVAFTSEASDLAPDASGPGSKVFIKDLATGALTLLSSSAYLDMFSADGTKAVLTSSAALVDDDTNDASDVFIKDLASGAIQRVSTDSTGSQSGPFSDSHAGVLSPDGTKVVFGHTGFGFSESRASLNDLYIKDLLSGETRLLAVPFGMRNNDGDSFDPVFSPDGQTVYFLSFSDTLLGESFPDRLTRLYAVDVATGAVALVSTENAAVGDVSGPAVSPDGSQIAFAVAAGSGAVSNVFLKDLASGDTSNLSTRDSRFEGDSDDSVHSFTILRRGDTTGIVEVSWSVSGEVDGTDFVGGVLPSGTLTFSAGEAFKTLAIAVAGDVAIENDEGFTVTLAGQTAGVSLMTASATSTIRNDDLAGAHGSLDAAQFAWEIAQTMNGV